MERTLRSVDECLISTDERTVSTVEEVVVWLTCTRGISPGEQICVSYLNQLCVNATTRREMLREAFCFDCQCDRCAIESGEIEQRGAKDEKNRNDGINDRMNEGIDDEERSEKMTNDALKNAIQGGNSKSSASNRAISWEQELVAFENLDRSLNTILNRAAENVPQNVPENVREKNPIDQVLMSPQEMLQLLVLSEAVSSIIRTYDNDGNNDGKNDGNNDKSLVQAMNAFGTSNPKSVDTKTDEFISEVRTCNVRTIQAVYSLHDSGMLVLKSALGHRKMLLSQATKGSGGGNGGGSGGGSGAIRQDDIDGIIFLASRTVLGCWKTLRCEV